MKNIKSILNNLLVTIVASSLTLTVIAQSNTFQKRYIGFANDEPFSIEQTSDNGYISVGTTQSFGAGNTDIYVLKTDVSGNVQWGRAIGGGNVDEGLTIRQLSNGDYIIGARTFSFGVQKPVKLTT